MKKTMSPSYQKWDTAESLQQKISLMAFKKKKKGRRDNVAFQIIHPHVEEKNRKGWEII